MIGNLLVGYGTTPGLLIAFGVCAAIIVAAGTALSKAGDKIGERTGLTGAWIGMVLLAGATSLPELVSCISAVTVFNVPRMAIGNIFGSNALNLTIIVILDLVQGRGPIMIGVKRGHILSAAFGVMMMCIAALGMTAMQMPDVIGGWVGWLCSAAIALVYFISARMLFKYEQDDEDEVRPEISDASTPAIVLYGKFFLSAAVIVVAGLWLIKLGAIIAERPFEIAGHQVTLNQTFVGTLFIALATSLPEVVVSVSALRMGLTDMAFGNLFGSNIMNVAFVPILEVLSGKEAILASSTPADLLTVAVAVILTSIAIVALMYRSKKSFLFLGWEAIAMAAVYLTGIYLVFKASAHLG